ncbi:MAG: DUF3823 domain-containing protein [Candidatus Cryptobacteroides sp.]
MNKFKYIFLSLALVAGFASCTNDNYDLPSETFKGAFIDKETGEPFQTAIGGTGIRIRMMEYSWSDNPQPYDFNAKMDGTFQNTKIFKGEYGVIPEGAFVPLEEEIIKIKGVVEKTYEVEPLLRVEWVGEPVVNADGTATVKVKITRGTDNPDYQQALQEGWLYVSETNYVGDFSYSPMFSTKIAAGQLALDTVLEFTTGYPNGISGNAAPFPNYERKYFLRFAAKINKDFSGVKRYNYSTVKEITTVKR